MRILASLVMFTEKKKREMRKMIQNIQHLLLHQKVLLRYLSHPY